jgi:hypothetical protein
VCIFTKFHLFIIMPFMGKLLFRNKLKWLFVVIGLIGQPSIYAVSSPTKKNFFRVSFLGTTPLPCATDEKSPKNLCAEKRSPEKQDRLTIVVSENVKKGTCILHNALGQSVKVLELKGEKTEVFVGDLPEAVYIYHIECNNYPKMYGEIIIEK